jgi:hypothetical protein
MAILDQDVDTSKKQYRILLQELDNSGNAVLHEHQALGDIAEVAGAAIQILWWLQRAISGRYQTERTAGIIPLRSDQRGKE